MGFYEDRLYPMTIRTVEMEAETPYLKQVVEGTLPIEKFKFQVKQNYNYLIEYANFISFHSLFFYFFWIHTNLLF